MRAFKGNVFAYYYDLSFEETLRRHSQRRCQKNWGRTNGGLVVGHDILGLPNEKIRTAELSQQEMIGRKYFQEIGIGR